MEVEQITRRHAPIAGRPPDDRHRAARRARAATAARSGSIGQAQVVRPAPARSEPIQLNGEHLHALPQPRAGSTRTYMVVVHQGDSEFNADGMEYDDVTRIAHAARQRARADAACRCASRPPRMTASVTRRCCSSPARPAASARRWRSIPRAGYRLALVARRGDEMRALGRRRRAGPPSARRSTWPTCATSPR